MIFDFHGSAIPSGNGRYKRYPNKQMDTREIKNTVFRNPIFYMFAGDSSMLLMFENKFSGESGLFSFVLITLLVLLEHQDGFCVRMNICALSLGLLRIYPVTLYHVQLFFSNELTPTERRVNPLTAECMHAFNTTVSVTYSCWVRCILT